MLRLETGRRSTVNTLFKCMQSSDLRALTFNSTSKPLLDRSFSFTVVRENVMGFPDKPRVSAKLLEQRVISEPSSRKAYVSTSGPPSAPLTLTGTTRRLTRGFPVPVAAHWPSLLTLSTFTPSGVSTKALSAGWVASLRTLSPGGCSNKWWRFPHPLKRQALNCLQGLAKWLILRRLMHNLLSYTNFLRSSKDLSLNLKHHSRSWLPLKNKHVITRSWLFACCFEPRAFCGLGIVEVPFEPWVARVVTFTAGASSDFLLALCVIPLFSFGLVPANFPNAVLATAALFSKKKC